MERNGQSPETSGLAIIDGHDAASLFACALSGREAGSWAAPAAEELAGIFPGFEVEELLGRGGMGAVYRARQASLDRDVAIKILPPDLGEDPEFAERFRREAQTVPRLNHPNIVHVHDFGHEPDSGLFYLVMEFVDGSDLREWIAETPMAPDLALRVAGEVCEALGHAHELGFVHRDVKPANVFLDAAGRVKIGDFGLAKLFSAPAGALELTTTGYAMGTADYCAPEVLRGDNGAIDCRADIFSLGVMLYELLTGARPRGNFAPPSRKVRVSRRVDAVVLKAIDEAPERRFASAERAENPLKATTEYVNSPWFYFKKTPQS